MARNPRPLFILAVLTAFAYLARMLKGNMDAKTYFVGTLRAIADKVETETGISARLGVIQAALESAYGTSMLSKSDANLTILPSKSQGPAFNIFGFKTGEAWVKAGRPYVMMPTTDYGADGKPFKAMQPFRAYPSWADSYRDWARLMQTPMYVADGALTALKAGDMAKFGAALGKHYAPNQDYGTRLAARAKEMAGLV
jgi:flagellar protein FlgJ